MSWTDERTEQLRALRADGLSASQIAAELGGGLTRNAVIGKLHRLGLFSVRPAAKSADASRRRAATRVRLRVRRAAAGSVPQWTKKAPPAAPEPPVEQFAEANDVPVEQRKTLLELEGTHCRFPFGEPRASSFFFCGGAKPDMQSIPYCPYHTAASRGGG